MDTIDLATHQPLSLPRFTATQAQALSQIAAHGKDFDVALRVSGGADDAASGVWRLSLATGALDALRQVASERVDLEWGGARLRLWVTPAVLTAWVNERAPELGLGDLPELLRAAALETLLSELVGSISSVSPGGPIYVVPSPADDHLPHLWTLTAVAKSTGHTAVALIAADDLGLMMLASLLAQATRNLPSSMPTESVPIPMRAEIGRTTLRAGEVATLCRGDVLLLDQYLVAPDGAFWLSLPSGQGIRVRNEQSSYIVTQGLTSLMTSTPLTPEDSDSSEALEVDEIPVTLTFDLGDCNLTLAELRQLQPGVIFDLKRPLAAGPVVIRANGAPVGSGELVEVDGRVGVRIGSWGKGDV